MRYWHPWYLLHIEGKIDAAIAEARKALELDPKLLPKVQIERGNIFFRLKNYTKAITEYQKVLQLDSTNKEASINAVMCNRFSGNSIEASLLLDQN